MGWRQCRATWQKNFAPSCFLSLEKKFEDHIIIEKLYKDTMQEYIFQGHTSKLSRTGAKRTTPTKSCLSHHWDKNINKPDKIRIVFDIGAKIQ